MLHQLDQDGMSDKGSTTKFGYDTVTLPFKGFLSHMPCAALQIPRCARGRTIVSHSHLQQLCIQRMPSSTCYRMAASGLKQWRCLELLTNVFSSRKCT
ncbi:hypothetical protein DPEC_G00176340, partial [Dallia pectoralis]